MPSWLNWGPADPAPAYNHRGPAALHEEPMTSRKAWLHFSVASLSVLLFFGARAADSSPPPAVEPFRLATGDVIVFAGGTNTVRAGKAGFLETLLTRRFADVRPQFRDLSWEGDTVFRQATVDDRWREEAFGDWSQQLQRVRATVVFAQYGQLEALQGKEGLAEFVAAYESLLTRFAEPSNATAKKRRIVLISPTPFEEARPPLPDLSNRNGDLQLYVDAIRGIAARRGFHFVDVFSRLVLSETKLALTTNGMHLLPQAQPVFATLAARELGDGRLLDKQPEIKAARLHPELEELRQALATKNRLWFDYWRPANWKCLFGDDSKRVFGRGTESHPSFREEWEQYPALIAAAEERIWSAAKAK